MSLRRRISAAAAAALLFAGLSNAHAHVHLCLDGSEAPATVHWTTGEALPQVHADSHDFPHAHEAPDGADALGAADHDDVDLEVSASAIAKTVKHDALAAAPSAVVLAHSPPRAAHAFARSHFVPRQPPASLRPQPRAPPRLPS
jgi:hypothetical protein